MIRAHRAIAVVLFLFLSATVFAEPTEPAPYTPDEFPQWTLHLRRGEIVAFGVFPLSLVASSLLYDLGRFGFRSVQAGRVDGDYAPWFFAPPGAPGLTDGERVGVLLGAVGISVTIAVVDHLLGRRERRGTR